MKKKIIARANREMIRKACNELKIDFNDLTPNEVMILIEDANIWYNDFDNIGIDNSENPEDVIYQIAKDWLQNRLECKPEFFYRRFKDLGIDE